MLDWTVNGVIAVESTPVEFSVCVPQGYTSHFPVSYSGGDVRSFSQQQQVQSKSEQRGEGK